MNIFRTAKQRGDTIVEVLIAMAVLGMVLGTAFAIANRSYAVGIAAQERTEALKIAESQIELLRLASEKTESTILDPVNPNILFCVDPTTSDLSRIEFSGPVQDTSGVVDPIAYDSGCTFGTDNRYKVSIEQTGTDNEIYSIRVRWESVLGGTIEEVNHVYRTYDFEGSYSLTSQVLTSTICEDPAATNFNGPLPCVYPPKCEDPAATNFNGPLPCVYPPKCEDPAAINFNGSLPCNYLPASIQFIVRKIPPAAGNNTPSCGSAATLNRSGTTISLNGTSNTTNNSSRATFNNLVRNTPYAASASAPAGHQLCSTTQTVTTGAAGSTVTNTVFKIRPICTNQLVGYTSGYWATGARRADLDNWYVTVNSPSWPTWNTSFIAGHYSAPGTFVYVFSGTNNSSAAYYYLYQAVWISGSPIYQKVCPS